MHWCRLVVLTSLVAATLAGSATTRVAAQEGAEVIQNRESLTDSQSTVPGVTPTPASNATPVPLETPAVVPGTTATPVPTAVGRDYYISPGYGNAAEQEKTTKRTEIDWGCAKADRPPTSHMLGIPGLRPANESGSWVPILIAVAFGAALFATVAFALRKSAAESRRPGVLEGVAGLVAICTGLAGLAAQFVPSADVRDRPAKETTLLVRDVKQRITRDEYLSNMRLTSAQWAKVRRKFSPEDFDELGNVIWLEIGLTGFKGQTVHLQYGLYDLDARGALLPDTTRKIELTEPEHDAQRLFYPAWVGYPRSARFKAEFRLVDSNGLQELAATRPMNGTLFRYACRDERE
jgi:hypothetical protein